MKSREERIPALIAALGDENAGTRQDARHELVLLGSAAVGPLLEQLYSPRPHVRWEAAKALSDLHDPESAEGLVRALGDEDRDVRWLASAGLIALGHSALKPLFRGLIHNADSTWVREGAEHVLRAMETSDEAYITHPVLDALDDGAPIFDVPIAAFDALDKLRKVHPPESNIERIMKKGSSA